MKKLLTIMLAVVLLASFTVGCTAEETPQENTPFEDETQDTPVNDMEEGIEGPLDEIEDDIEDIPEGPEGLDENPSGNDNDLDNPTTEDEETPQS